MQTSRHPLWPQTGSTLIVSKIECSLSRSFFLSSKADPSMFYKKNANELIVMLVYVDDILLKGKQYSVLT